MSNTLSSWKLKKIGIIGTLVAVSVIGALPLVFDLGPKWLIIPVIFILLMIWLLGRKIYACPHCKTPIDLRLHLHTNMKCTKCGKSIMD